MIILTKTRIFRKNKIYKLSAHPKENFKGGRGWALKKVAPTQRFFFHLAEKSRAHPRGDFFEFSGTYAGGE